MNIFRIAKQAGLHLVYGSDAHCLSDIGTYDFVFGIMKQIGMVSQDLYQPTKKGIQE